MFSVLSANAILKELLLMSFATMTIKFISLMNVTFTATNQTNAQLHPKRKKNVFNKTFDEVRKEFYDKMSDVAKDYKHLSIEVIWQCEWRFKKLHDLEVIKFLKTYIPWPSHHISPREAVRGARIETFMLKWRQQDHLDETMYYLDCSSLYPFMG